MGFFFLLVKYLPYWAIPIASIAVLDVAVGFKRRGQKRIFLLALAVAFILVVLTICFFLFGWEKEAAKYLLDSAHVQ